MFAIGLTYVTYWVFLLFHSKFQALLKVFQDHFKIFEQIKVWFIYLHKYTLDF